MASSSNSNSSSSSNSMGQGFAAFPLTAEQIAQFQEEGILVVEGVLTEDEVRLAREGFHRTLLQHGVDHDRPDPDLLKRLGRFGDHAQFFYPSWKLAVQEHPNVFSVISQLWAATFATSEGCLGLLTKPPPQGGDKGGTGGLWDHPYGRFDPGKGYFYLDRVNYRVPDSVVVQGGLGVHFDCSTHDPYHLEDGIPCSKWRPIQAWVALTDQYGGRCGNLTAARSFHKEFLAYSQAKRGRVVGRDFTLVDSKADGEVWRRAMRPVDAPAGSMVLWDNRLPHATAKHHDGPDSREVIFTGFLPDVPINREYAAMQLERYIVGAKPPDFGAEHKQGAAKREETNHRFSPLGRRLMAIEPWGDQTVDGKRVEGEGEGEGEGAAGRPQTEDKAAGEEEEEEAPPAKPKPKPRKNRLQ